ncbi:MAG: response regulator [Pleurocapsa minor GSE-CHR-MK-17-07R]|jgi:two-component system cell cycle response regulator DivK|nr:response regulator [Pleurocapsa minor GSE-CHR-MK 17-07R]
MRQVLIIDDDTSSREVFRQVLKTVGFEAVEAADGETAIQLLNQYAPNLILLDLRLPRISGTEILRYIYEQPHLSNTRVIVATAHQGMSASITLRSGDTYLVKPISASLLRETALNSIGGIPTA